MFWKQSFIDYFLKIVLGGTKEKYHLHQFSKIP